MKLRKNIFVFLLFVGGCNFRKDVCYKIAENRAEMSHTVLCNFRGWVGCEPLVREKEDFKRLFLDIEAAKCSQSYGPK